MSHNAALLPLYQWSSCSTNHKRWKDKGFSQLHDGNGVYLTELDPRTYNQADIAMNNWMDDSPEIIRKTENYFVLDIPVAEVEDCYVRGTEERLGHYLLG